MRQMHIFAYLCIFMHILSIFMHTYAYAYFDIYIHIKTYI